MLRECEGNINDGARAEVDVVAVSGGLSVWMLHMVQVLCGVQMTC